jgi:hypothetical protein
MACAPPPDSRFSSTDTRMIVFYTPPKLVRRSNGPSVRRLRAGLDEQTGALPLWRGHRISRDLRDLSRDRLEIVRIQGTRAPGLD